MNRRNLLGWLVSGVGALVAGTVRGCVGARPVLASAAAGQVLRPGEVLGIAGDVYLEAGENVHIQPVPGQSWVVVSVPEPHPEMLVIEFDKEPSRAYPQISATETWVYRWPKTGEDSEYVATEMARRLRGLTNRERGAALATLAKVAQPVYWMARDRWLRFALTNPEDVYYLHHRVNYGDGTI